MDAQKLLELAAKAAGMVVLELPWDNVDGWFFCEQHEKPGMHFRKYGGPHYSGAPWIPLDDDGDALRLAVKLGLFLEIDRPNQRASALPPNDDQEFSRELFCDDPCAAIRRAIVRAAAEIGKAMP